MATREEVKYAHDVINSLIQKNNFLKGVGDDLTTYVARITEIQNTPALLQKLLNGISAMSDYTTQELLAIKSNLNNAATWINANIDLLS